MAPPNRSRRLNEQKPSTKPDGKPSNKSGKDKKNSSNSTGDGGEKVPEIKKTVLPGPTQSPRDPNLYRVIHLQNGMRIGLSSICAFTDEENKKIIPCASMGRVKSGTRSKCKRTRSDLETPKNKRTRSVGVVVNDSNCVNTNVANFNTEILHLCDNLEECQAKPTGGFLSMTFFCCNNGNPEDLSVEGDADKPDQMEQKSNPEPTTNDNQGESTATSGEEQENTAYNLWNKADRLAESEDNDETGPRFIDCSKGCAAVYSYCSAAITMPWGPIFESDESPGVSEICRNCIQGCDYYFPSREEGLTTFIVYVPHQKGSKLLNDAVENLATKFSSPSVDKTCIEKAMKRITEGGTFSDRLKTSSWAKGYENLLLSPKRIKLLSTLSKADHPIRRCALGGKANKRIQDSNRSSLDRAMNEYLQNNLKPQYMSVAIEAPESLDNLEGAAVKFFGQIGGAGSTKNPDTLKIDGELDPFNTEEFRKWYRVYPCPTKCGDSCTECHSIKSLIISFPLPGDAWKNYKTRPLIYLSHVIAHKGNGGLHEYLCRKNWATNLRAECSHTQFHRNQFCTLFEIFISLTNEGLDHHFEVIKAIFSYLKLLTKNGPKKQVFKDLQKIQAIDFHSLGKDLSDVRMIQDARSISRGLQFAKSEDIVLSQSIMTSYNGQLLKEYLDLLKPDFANYMLVSNTFEEKEINKLEEFLGTKYAVEDLPDGWLSSFKDIDPYPEFTLLGPNNFIPENFCIVGADCIMKAKWVSGDDFHDLWHLQDPRYKTRAGAIIHFVSPLAMIDLDSAVKTTFLYRIFKSVLEPALYPAELADIQYCIDRTNFGILVKILSNSDKLGMTMGTMADTFHNIQDSLTQEIFENQLANFRKEICCKIKEPWYYSSSLHTTAVFLNSWCETDYLPVIDSLTLEKFKSFIDAVKKDLYFMLLVVGNATEENAQEICDSILMAMNSTGGKNIEQVDVLQWPVGEHILRVKGFGPSTTKTLMTNHYQMGLADSKTITMAAIIEPSLQDYFLQSENLMSKNICVMVGGYQIYNVLELQFEIETPKHLTPEAVNNLIDYELEEFYKEKLEFMNNRELEEMKEFYLCKCEQGSSWFTPCSDLNLLSQCVLNLNMNAVEIDVQRKSCECLKTKDIIEWFSKYFLKPCEEYTLKDIPERRKLTIIVMQNSDDQPTPENNTATKKKKNKDKGPPCGKEDCKYLETTYEIPGDDDKCKNKKGNRKKNVQEENQEVVYIRDLDDFKHQTCFIYPSYIPRD